MSKEHLKKTDRTNLVRNPSRADYDRDVVNGIIDATSLCHVSYIIDGRPYVTPTSVSYTHLTLPTNREV